MPRSKRKSSGNQDQTAVSKRKKGNEIKENENLEDATIFGQLIKQAGLCLKSKQPHVLRQEPTQFLKNLKSALKKHPDYPEVMDQFVDCFCAHADDVSRFHLSLVPCVMSSDCDSFAGCTPDSLVRLLLSIDDLQAKLGSHLLEKLAEIAEDSPVIKGVGKVNFSPLIMNQFRWLDNIVNSEELVEKMFEIISVTPAVVQSEIIMCLPEVIDDSQHYDITHKLRDLLNDNNALAVPIIDALTMLDIKSDLLSEVRASVVQSLPSVSAEDLPVMLKFLLLRSFSSSSEAIETVNEVRLNLDLQSLVQLVDKQRCKDKKSNADIEVLIIDGIKTAMRFQKIVSEAWLKSIDKTPSNSNLSVLDLLVLFVMHSINWKKPTESLIRNKIRSGDLTSLLFLETASQHTQVTQDYFPAVLRIAEILLRSPEPNINLFACDVYKHAFTHLDVYCRQEIVSILVTHIGSGSAMEVDGSFDVLLFLVLEESEKMAPFGVFIKGILDYVANLNMSQIRKLYCILSNLALNSSSDESVIQDELHIIIRKQLSTNDIKYQRMGVIGAVMVMKNLAAWRAEDGEDMSEERLQMVISLLQLVYSCVGRVPQACGLFLDELAAVILAGKVHPKVQTWISDNVISDFQDNFISDLDPKNKKGLIPLPWSIQYGLDEEAEDSIVINLIQLLAANFSINNAIHFTTSKAKLASPLCMASQFRLLHVCESQQHGGDLEGINALLGCALMLPEAGLVEKLKSMKETEQVMFCQALFLALNWFRELLNAFSTQTDPEMKAKVIARLHNITKLHSLIEAALSVVPGVVPPQVNFDVDHVMSVAPAAASAKRVTKATKKGKKKVRDGIEEGDESRITSQMDEIPATGKETAGTATSRADFKLSDYRHFLREIDLGVFEVLRTGVITKAALDTNNEAKDLTTLQIQPTQMIFLLEDLVAKLQHSLLASVAKRQTFFRSKAASKIGFSHLDDAGSLLVAQQVVALLPTLCDQLQAANTFFQSSYASEDSFLDSHVFSSEEAQQMSLCFHLLLQAILRLISWVGFSSADNRALLKEALNAFASRLNSSLTSQASLEQLVKQAFVYLENFAVTIPHLPASVTLCEILVALEERLESASMLSKIHDICGQMLKRKWSEDSSLRPAQINEHLQTLLKMYFSHSTDVMAILENLSTVAVPQLFEGDKNSCSEEYSTLNRSSYSLYYRVMLRELVDCVTTFQAAKAKQSNEVIKDKLLQWNRAVRIFYSLVNLVKSFEGRANIGSLLKWGRQFLEAFLRQCMPMLDHAFVAHKDDVQALLKNLQLSTRSLQNMCSHSKHLKNGALINHVPLLKKTLETFVYRVKAMLTMNKSLEAFWLGNLKNRDLHGEEIVSQVSKSTQDESDEDEAVPDDDQEQSDIELDVRSEGGPSIVSDDESRDGSSYSEIF